MLKLCWSNVRYPNINNFTVVSELSEDLETTRRVAEDPLEECTKYRTDQRILNVLEPLESSGDPGVKKVNSWFLRVHVCSISVQK